MPTTNWTPFKFELSQLLKRYSMEIQEVSDTDVIPSSYWGDSEAGIDATTLYLRSDTPLHSALHEACHFICMDEERRRALNTDAGGTDVEENAVCYLQILLSDLISGYSKSRMFSDMDEWGYSFRLGSAKRWYEEDAEDAVQFLMAQQLISQHHIVCIGQLSNRRF